jgi:adenylate kinase family enzyme
MMLLMQTEPRFPSPLAHDEPVVTIVVAGPQATGKTTLALALGRALGLPVFSRDPLMRAVAAGRPRWVRRLSRGRTAAAGLRVQTALLAAQLEQGQGAVLECVAPAAAKAEWRRLTTAHGGRYLAVECVCSDPELHLDRLKARRVAAGGRGPSWRTVQSTMRAYQPDPAADVTADAVRPVDELVTQIASMLAH